MRLRLPFACGPACALCRGVQTAEAQSLDAILEHAMQTGQRRVYLQGENVASDSRLPSIARRARTFALHTALVEEGQGHDLAAQARALRQLEIADVYLSVGANSDPRGGSSPQAWASALEPLAALGRGGDLRPGVHVQLGSCGNGKLLELIGLQARLGIRGLLISDPPDDEPSRDAIDAAAAVEMLEAAWRNANALGLRMSLVGFAQTRYVQPALGAPAPAVDEALIDFVRRGIPFSCTRAGVRAREEPGYVSGLKNLAADAAEIRNLGLELAARRAPFIDAPPCLGGVLADVSSEPVAPGSRLKADACGACALDHRCRGVPEGIADLPSPVLESALRPLSSWNSIAHPPRILILSSQGEDLVFYACTLPGLARVLNRRGAKVEIVSPWVSRWTAELPLMRGDVAFHSRWEDLVSGQRHWRTPNELVANAREWWKAKRLNWKWRPDWEGTSGVQAWLAKRDLGEFDLVIASDLDTARLALEAGSPGAAPRIAVLDFHMLKGMDGALARWLAPGARAAEGDWWPTERLVLESGFPGYVTLYRNYGVPLEQVVWRPYTLHPEHFPPGPDVRDCRVIMSGGNHLRDLETLLSASERLSSDVHPLVLFDQGERFAGNDQLRHAGEVPLRSFYHAVANSRFVVIPLREDVNRAAGVTVVVMALMAGRPIVATDTTAIRDYVSHGAEALLVPAGDPAALADAITRLDTDPVLLSRLAAGAREAGRRVSTEHWADCILAGAPSLPISTPHGWRNW